MKITLTVDPDDYQLEWDSDDTAAAVAEMLRVIVDDLDEHLRDKGAAIEMPAPERLQ